MDSCEPSIVPLRWFIFKSWFLGFISLPEDPGPSFMKLILTLTHVPRVLFWRYIMCHSLGGLQECGPKSERSITTRFCV